MRIGNLWVPVFVNKNTIFRLDHPNSRYDGYCFRFNDLIRLSIRDSSVACWIKPLFEKTYATKHKRNKSLFWTLKKKRFSTLRRLKNYLLRLTGPMTQERFNHVAVHHVHKTRVDALDINKIKQLFIHVNEYRRSVFGQFDIWLSCKLMFKHDCMEVAAHNCLGDR